MVNLQSPARSAVALALLVLAAAEGAHAVAECSFFARVRVTQNEDGRWIKIEPLNVNEFFADGPSARRCTATLGDFGPESFFDFAQAPGEDSYRIFLVDMPIHLAAEGVALYGSVEALVAAIEAAGGALEISLEGTAVEGGLPIGMTANALFTLLPDGTPLGIPLSVRFENKIDVGGPIGHVLGIGSRDVICSRQCGQESVDSEGAVRPFYFLFDDGTESFLRTTMEVEDEAPGVQLLTNAEVVPCTCSAACGARSGV